MCDMNHSCVWHDSFICVSWHIHMCDMTHSYLWHDLFTCVTWPIHICDMTHAYVWHDTCICVSWLIHRLGSFEFWRSFVSYGLGSLDGLCSILVSVCCSVLQCIAVYCNVLHCVAGCYICISGFLWAVAWACWMGSAQSWWARVAMCCSVLQRVAACCSVL